MNGFEIKDVIQDALYGKKECSQHGIVLLSLICSINAKNVLELGVRHGGTNRPLLIGVHLTDGHLTSVDINPPSFREDLGSPHPPAELCNKWTFHQTDAIQFLTNTTQKYDLIFVDDWHGSEHVYKELSLIKNLLNERSLIVLHDLMHSFNDPHYNKNHYPQGNEFEGTGPYGGVIKFVQENPDFEFVTIPVNHGLTILRKAT